MRNTDMSRVSNNVSVRDIKIVERELNDGSRTGSRQAKRGYWDALLNGTFMGSIRLEGGEFGVWNIRKKKIRTIRNSKISDSMSIAEREEYFNIARFALLEDLLNNIASNH